MRPKHRCICGVVLAVAWLAQDSQLAAAQPQCAPGKEAARAEALIEQGKEREGCDAMLAAVRAGSKDPWVYRGAALCAARGKEAERRAKPFLAALERPAVRPELAAFGRGFHAWIGGNHPRAEKELLQALARSPRLALAANALGAVMQARGDAAGAIPHIENALRRCPKLDLARRNLQAAELRARVFERLLGKLRSIPARWKQLPAPAMKPSGRGIEEALQAASKAEQSAALALISKVALTPPRGRAAALAAAQKARKLTEADLWFPGLLAQNEQLDSVEEAALTVDGWLDLATHLGRRDVLLVAASFAFNLSALRVPPLQVGNAAEKWAALPVGTHGQRGAAMVAESYATLLFRTGQNRLAVKAYRQGRKHFVAVGSQLGQGNTFRGEADVLFRLGDNEGALKAYRQGRRHFVAVGSQLGQGNTFLGEADVLFLLGDNEGALKAYRQGRRHFVAVGSQLGQGNTFRGEADVLFRLGDNEGALKAYRQGRRHFVAVGSQLGQGNTFRGEADVLFLLGDNERALKAYRQGRRHFVAVGSQLGQGNTFRGEADVLFRLGDNEGALKAYRQGRRHFVAVGSQLGQGNTFLGEADVLFRLGDNERALKAYRQGRRHFVAVGSQLGQGNTFRGEADVLFRLGDNEGALKAYRQGRRHFVAVGSQLGQGNTFRGEADVLFRLGDNEGALKAYRQGRMHFVAVGSQLGQGNTFLGEADVLFRLGDNEGALKAYRQGRTHFVAVGSQLGQGNTFLGEADVLFRLGDNEGALKAYRQGRRHFVAVGSQLGQGNTFKGEADVLLRLDKPGPAGKAARRAILLATRTAATQNEITARMVLARALAAQGRDREADKRALEALAVFERGRARGVGDMDRTAMANRSDPYDFLVPRLSASPKRASRALQLAEAAHAPVLLDLLASRARRAADSNNLALLRQRQRVHKKRADMQRQLDQTLGASERSTLLARQRDLDRGLEHNELAALASLPDRLTSSSRIRVAAQRALVAKAGPVILYYVAGEETVAFLLLPGRKAPLVRRVSAVRGQLRREVRALRHDLANPMWQSRARPRARSLFDQLIGPWAARLAGHPRLTIIPHGPLHQLPFEALLDSNGKRVFERWHVTIAPSLSALHLVRQRAARRQAGNPSFLALASGQGLQLPDREIDDIAARFGVNRAESYQHETTFDIYEELAPKADHVLISTHGKHTHNSRTGTYLEVAATESHDHRLTAGEIAQIPLRAQLVTLAACDTARAEAMLSDERLDLTRAFLIAGAGAVLATRWKVPESQHTRQFLIDFYRALRTGKGGQGMRKDEALTHARRQARQNNAPAQVWAAWVLVGDGR